MMTTSRPRYLRRITGSLWIVCNFALLGCRFDRFERPEASYLGGGHDVATTREPMTAPPRLVVSIALSDFAVAHFIELQLDVAVESGQSLFEQGASGRWLDEGAGADFEVDFGEPASSALTLVSTLDAVPCDAGPCELEFELLPRGEWSSDVAFPIDYHARVSLELERRDRLALESDLEVSLEVLP